MPTVCCDAGGFVGHLLQPGRDLAGALQRRRVGQLHVDQQIALVLLGNEADGYRREAPVGQVEQAAVDQQHEQADAEERADQRGYRRRCRR